MDRDIPSSDPCVFCHPRVDHVLFAEPLVIALWDAFPVSRGHALVIPRRHVANWFDATAEEQQQMLQATHRVRDEIERQYRPDGYNLGINVGLAAGQTVLNRD